MADTERTLAALQALLADNTTQDISAQDLRDFLVTALGGYASISVTGGFVTQGSLDNVTPVKLTCFTANGSYLGATPDHTDDSILVNTDGLYLFVLSCSFTGTATTNYVLSAGIAGVAQTDVQAEAVYDGTGTVTASCVGILSVSSGQKVSAMVSIVEAPVAQAITVKRANLTLKRIG